MKCHFEIKIFGGNSKYFIELYLHLPSAKEPDICMQICNRCIKRLKIGNTGTQECMKTVIWQKEQTNHTTFFVTGSS